MDKNINAACTQGIITKKDKKELNYIRNSLRNAYSHADAFKIHGNMSIPATGAKLTEQGIQLENEDVAKIAMLSMLQGIAQAKHAEANAIPVGKMGIFKENELDEKSTVQKMHIPLSDRPVSFFNLDVILSVGYRVNSKRGTQFRIWANRILKDYLIKGYAINQRRLREKTEEIELLKSSLRIVERSLKNQVDTLEQATTIVSFLADFSGGLGILDDYDHEQLDAGGKTQKTAVIITVEECYEIIKHMNNQFASDLFGKLKDASFESSVKQIYQSFSGQDVSVDRRKSGHAFISCR